MLRNRHLCYKLDRILSLTTLLPSKCQRIPITSGRGCKWSPSRFSIRPYRFLIYVNDLTDILTINHLLFADDVKLIAPRKQAAVLQSSLVASSKWSEDWEFILNPSKFEHLLFGDTFNPVTYCLTSRTSPNAQPFQTVSSVRDLGLLLNAGFSADHNVAHASQKSP